MDIMDKLSKKKTRTIACNVKSNKKKTSLLNHKAKEQQFFLMSVIYIFFKQKT